MNPSRLVFVAPYGYPALAGAAAVGATRFGYVGGAEMQQARLARVLAARGHDIWMVSADFGQPRRVTIDGVHVERAYAPFAGVPGVRFFHPRLSSLWTALSRVDAGIVYQRTAGGLTGQCAFWAGLHHRRFVFACAHDYDVLPRSPSLKGSPRDRWLYREGLHRADVVLAQSEAQVRGLAQNHALRATIVRNVIELPAAPRPDGAADAVVWLGTIKPEKRPEWMLEAARELPHVRFVVAGGPPPPPTGDAAYRAFREAARALPNVETTGFVAPAAVPGLLARARVFAHTSPAEGFPNTLLEAWALGVPSVSVVDPDGAVSAGGAGAPCADAASFTRALARMWDDTDARRSAGERARAWVTTRHAPSAVARAFEDAVGLPAPAAVDTEGD
jgi:glycosyltransferase involved in cell wall biosynthesis